MRQANKAKGVSESSVRVQKGCAKMLCKNGYNTQGSTVVPYRSTNCAQRFLASLIGTRSGVLIVVWSYPMKKAKV